MTIEIVRVSDRRPVGLLEVAPDGRIAFVSGQPDLADIVQEHLAGGIFAIESEYAEDGEQFAVPRVATPDEPDYEHRLTAFLMAVGYQAARHR